MEAGEVLGGWGQILPFYSITHLFQRLVGPSSLGSRENYGGEGNQQNIPPSILPSKKPLLIRELSVDGRTALDTINCHDTNLLAVHLTNVPFLV